MVPPINKFVQKKEIRVNFEELCYQSKLTNLEVKKYFVFLKKRIRDIEQTIDSHFDMIKKSIRQDKKEKIERKMKKDQEEKEKQEKERRKNQPDLGKGGSSNTNRSKSNRSKAYSKRSNISGEDVPSKVQKQMELQYEEKIIQETLDADPDLQFDDPKIYTYDKKLEQLYEFEDELLRVDRIQKENRRGLQTICRMQGSNSQSYFLQNSQTLKIAREIFYELNDAGTKYHELGIRADVNPGINSFEHQQPN